MNRPKVYIAKEPLDHALELGALILLVATFSYAAMYYGRLPDTIPVHFNASGDPDRYGQKTTLLVIPAIGLFIFVGLRYLSRFPEHFNYPVPITSENAAFQYRAGLRLLRSVNLACMALFTYLTFGTIQTATGNWNGLGAGIFWFIILGIVALIWQAVRLGSFGKHQKK
jgi:uncharacterized membrane protein